MDKDRLKILCEVRKDKWIWQFIGRCKKHKIDPAIADAFLDMVMERYADSPANILWKLWNSKNVRQNITEAVNIKKAQKLKGEEPCPTIGNLFGTKTTNC